MPAPDDVLSALRVAGRQPAGALLARLGISRATLMRAVQALGPRVLAMGKARRTTYAATRPIRGSLMHLPLYCISQAGQVEELATLVPLHGGTALQLRRELGWPVDEDMAQGWFDGIPYMLDDMRPQGFLGRHFARANAALLQVPEDPTRWSDDDILYVLSLCGMDVPGCYILGETALRSWLARTQQPIAAIEDDQVEQAYPALAQAAMAQGIPGSSAGGEFPKFTAVRRIEGEIVHVLVKFSGSDASAGTQRWSDLLVCEHLASTILRDQLQLEAACSRLRQAGGRTFLEVTRFDRHGAHGRSPLCSWAALNAGVVGAGPGPWTAAAQALAAHGWIDAATRAQIERLWQFGKLIANTDMHEGNLSFRPGLALAPAYDMLPMLYAPERGVELPAREFTPVPPIPAERQAWDAAQPAAIAFWERAAADPRISAEFRAICAANAQRVQAMR